MTDNLAWPALSGPLQTYPAVALPPSLTPLVPILLLAGFMLGVVLSPL